MSEEGELYCNLRACHKCLNDGYAWITSCSHIFCIEDGEKVFQNSLICPVCQKELDAKIDLIRIKLTPSDLYRNMILCGIKPSVIFDICQKGIQFWFNQQKQEINYLNYMIEKEREKRLRTETVESNSEYRLKQMQVKNDELKKENENLKKQLQQQQQQSISTNNNNHSNFVSNQANPISYLF